MHFQFRNKGILVLPIMIFSVVAVFVSFGLIAKLVGLKQIKHIEQLLGGISMLLAGLINFFVSKNYIINSEGQEEWYEEEGSFMYIRVTLWTRILLVLGILSILAGIAQIYKL